MLFQQSTAGIRLQRSKLEEARWIAIDHEVDRAIAKITHAVKQDDTMSFLLE